MQFVLTAACLVLAIFATGCEDASRIKSEAGPESSVSYITADEFADTVAAESNLVLVEFCVPAGCFRCDEMRAPVDQLASDERERITIRRVNLNQHPALARQLGVSVCPSYIAFRDGEEVFRAAYPTSADLIVAGLDESLRNSTAE